MKIRTLIAVIHLVAAFASKIHIWEPKSLKSIYSHSSLEYTVMDFGSVPYGHSIYGTVFKATPYDACTELKPLEWDKNYGTLIILLARGGCNFSEKVLNAQKIGAGFVLIADNSDENVHKIFPIERSKEMLDKVHIPSVLISKHDSENILKALSAPGHKPHDNKESRVELAIHFDLTKSYDKSKVKVIVAVDDYRCYDLLLNFEPYHKLFWKNINYDIHFKLFYNSQQFFDDDDCIGPKEAHYCAAKSFGNNKKGLGLPQETLKQLCLKNYDFPLFIKYVEHVRHYCFEDDGSVKASFKDCTTESFDNIVSSKHQLAIEDCMKPKTKASEKALAINHDKIKYFLINYSPIVFINGSYYKGNYDNTSELIETLCDSFEYPPSQCSNLDYFVQTYDLNSHHLNRFIIICLLFCIGCAFTALLIFYIMYKKRIKKTFNFTLNDKINEALAKYYNDEEKEGEEDADINNTESGDN